MKIAIAIAIGNKQNDIWTRKTRRVSTRHRLCRLGLRKMRMFEWLHRFARDQWLRASQSIPLNIAEGNGKTADADRRRYFEIARGSVLECAAVQDVLMVGKALDEQERRTRKLELDRIAGMLTRLGGRGYRVQEESTTYNCDNRNCSDIDSDSDSDSDSSNRVIT